MVAHQRPVWAAEIYLHHPRNRAHRRATSRYVEHLLSQVRMVLTHFLLLLQRVGFAAREGKSLHLPWIIVDSVLPDDRPHIARVRQPERRRLLGERRVLR